MLKIRNDIIGSRKTRQRKKAAGFSRGLLIVKGPPHFHRLQFMERIEGIEAVGLVAKQLTFAK